MRLLYVAPASSIHTKKWLTFFASKGHEVHLAYPALESALAMDNVLLHPLKSLAIKPLRYFAAIRQIKQIIRAIRPDILHVHYATFFGLVGLFSGFHPFVLTTWGSDVIIAPRESIFWRIIVKRSLNLADLITCDAYHLSARIAELGARAEKIQIIGFGIDTHRFSPASISETIRQEMHLRAEDKVVISLRNLNPIYDLGTLLQAIPSVLQAVPNARFVIAGDGVQRAQLQQQARTLGIWEQVRFVGSIPNPELPKWLTSSDVYVSTSLSDGGLSSCTAEAMACGLPVVITDFGDNSRWVRDGEGGYLIPLRNPAALADRIVLLLANEELRDRMGKINRKQIEERNSYEVEMLKMEHLYYKLMEGIRH